MKTVLIYFVLSCQLIIASGQSYLKGELIYANAESGLKLRAENNINSKVLKILKSGHQLMVLESDFISEILKIEDKKGSWLQVIDTTDLITGFVFDYYISKYPPFEFIENDTDICWLNDVLLDMANSIGKLDSFEYSNYSDGEGWYNLKYYELNKNAKYIEHGHWEDFENELQLSNLNTQEIFRYVNSLLQYCKENFSNYNQDYFETSKVLSLNINLDCCVHFIRIYSEGNNLIIRIQSDSGS